MKKLIFMTLFAFAAMGIMNAQTTYKVEGNTYSSVSVEKQKTEDILTPYTYKDSKGGEHQIFITKNGRCYYKGISKKSGNEYKTYLKEEISRDIAKKMGIEYKEKKKK